MNNFPSLVKQKLNSIISDMAEHCWLFSEHPGRDFSRQEHGKLSFYDTMRLIIGMGKGSTSDEIMDYFDLNPALIPSQSAFVQRRAQISLSAFQYLFSEFSHSFPNTMFIVPGTNGTKEKRFSYFLAFSSNSIMYLSKSDMNSLS